MTMIKHRDIRCNKCGKKLGEFYMTEGSIRIMCMFNAGRGSGSCRTLNVVTVRRKKNNTIATDAI